MRRLCLTLIGILVSVSAYAQTPPPVTVPVNTILTIEWDSEHSLALASFRAVVDGAIVKSFVTADLTVTTLTDLTKCTAPGANPPPTSCFTYRATIPGVTRGTHSLVVRAFNELGQADSPALTFIAGVVPRAPSLPRISVTATSAGLTIEIRDERALSSIANLFIPSVPLKLAAPLPK
jgi:hypothetical protein